MCLLSSDSNQANFHLSLRPSLRHLAMLETLSLVTSWSDATGLWNVAKHPTKLRTASTTDNFLAQDVNITETEKLWLKRMQPPKITSNVSRVF
jgi:hypothetical protein